MGRLSPADGQVPHVLRTRSPLGIAAPFDLHVLGTPPAFVLSQDQTLHRDQKRPRPKSEARQIRELGWFWRTFPTGTVRIITDVIFPNYALNVLRVVRGALSRGKAPFTSNARTSFCASSLPLSRSASPACECRLTPPELVSARLRVEIVGSVCPGCEPLEAAPRGEEAR